MARLHPTIVPQLALLACLAGCGDGTPDNALPTAGRLVAPSCTANNDGVIDTTELVFSPGLTVPYAVQAGTGLNVTGDPAAGTAEWRFDQLNFGGLVEVPTLDPQDTWYADAAPEADFGLTLDLGTAGTPRPGHLLLQTGEDAVSIVGVASVAQDDVLLLYDTPVPFLRFPLALGAHWGATTGVQANSKWTGIPQDVLDGLNDTYAFEVVGRGRMVMDGMSLDNVLEVSMSLSRPLASGGVFSARETFFLHECLGVVARRAEPGGAVWVVWYPE